MTEKKERRISDIENGWIYKNDNYEVKFLKEGDVVLLHNGGIDNGDQIMGVAVLVWDSEYHGWDYSMIAGEYVDSEYDRWNQSPRVIGYKENKDNNFYYKEFDSLVITDEEYLKWQCKWDKLIEMSKLEVEKKVALEEGKNLLKELKTKQKELQEELNENSEYIKDTDEKIKSIRKGDEL